ncbi:type II secretion system minor pseudopilin GspK [uncultured Tateyamaria sp.]|uniref:type II secretion system minor pseudopilin GspK n=1 Tax=Tateyamaria sp. 1078 TaxID=3417464 RepID=UPI002613E52A|nr:type II secretion system minor pseudopilin GspK [uncultured Tateyamaria sp.]
MRRAGQAGFVLVNALVLVAAMAAAAVFVLAQAETGRAQLAASQDADQLAAYLDAFESHAMVALTRDSINVDHPSDLWAGAATPFALDRGTVTGHVTDAAGRFNINWLANPADTAAHAAFARLARDIGLRQGITKDLLDALSFAPAAPDGYRRLDPPLRPPGGALTLQRQLDDIPALTPEDRARLIPYIAILPGDSQLNINTAPVAVVASFFPDAATSDIAGALAARQVAPILSVNSFFEAVELAQGTGLGDGFDRGRFAVNTWWFSVDIRAALGPRSAVRTLLLERRGESRRPLVRWRVTQFR